MQSAALESRDVLGRASLCPTSTRVRCTRSFYVRASFGCPGESRVELLAGLLLSLTAAVVGVWGITRRDRPLHGMRDDGTLGLPRLQRWDVSYRPPRLQRLRSAVPRFENGRVLLLTLLILMVAGGGFFAYSRIQANNNTNTARLEQALIDIQTSRAAAAAEPDLATAYAMLVQARTRLDELVATAPSALNDQRVVVERAAVVADIDRLANLRRLDGVQVVGKVPAGPSGLAPSIFAGGGHTYVLADALYQVDSATRTLVRLIGAGDQVGGGTVGTLRGGAWRDDRPIVMDERAIWSLDPTQGTWVREALSTFDSNGYTDVQAVEIYGRNVYALATDSGQILKFTDQQYNNPPEDWTGGLNGSDLTTAVDIAVDGRVYVLLRDGRVLDFFLARLEATLAPTYVPPLDSPAAIFASPNSTYIYLLNGSDGRIVRLARDGSSFQQFMPPAEMPQLRNAQDLTIDESSGVAYVLADQVLYALRVPPPTR